MPCTHVRRYVSARTFMLQILYSAVRTTETWIVADGPPAGGVKAPRRSDIMDVASWRLVLSVGAAREVACQGSLKFHAPQSTQD